MPAMHDAMCRSSYRPTGTEQVLLHGEGNRRMNLPQHPLDRKLVEHRAPRWLIDGKRKMMQSETWATMTNAVQEEMSRLLKQNRVRYFSDLNADEQAVLIDEVESNLASTRAYNAVQTEIASLLHDGIRADVEEELAAAGNRKSKLQLILDAAAEGATRLLEELPMEQKSMLRLMFHCEFPAPLRCHAWKQHLCNSQGRSAFLKRVNKARIDTISPADTAITQCVEKLLENKRLQGLTVRSTFARLEHRAVVLLKTALSYLHVLALAATGNNSTDDSDADGAAGNGHTVSTKLVGVSIGDIGGEREAKGLLKLASPDDSEAVMHAFFPLLVVLDQRTSDVADYVEAAIALQLQWPRFFDSAAASALSASVSSVGMATSDSLTASNSSSPAIKRIISATSAPAAGISIAEQNGIVTLFSVQLTDELQRCDMELLNHLRATLELWADDQGQATKIPDVAELLYGVLERRFVGVLNMRACLWLWDQVLLVGTEALLAPICAVILVLLRDLLLQCQTRASAERVLLLQAHNLTVRQLQQQGDVHYVDGMRRKLGIGTGNRGATGPSGPLPSEGDDGHSDGDCLDFMLKDLAERRAQLRADAGHELAERLGLTAAQERQITDAFDAHASVSEGGSLCAQLPCISRSSIADAARQLHCAESIGGIDTIPPMLDKEGFIKLAAPWLIHQEEERTMHARLEKQKSIDARARTEAEAAQAAAQVISSQNEEASSQDTKPHSRASVRELRADKLRAARQQELMRLRPGAKITELPELRIIVAGRELLLDRPPYTFHDDTLDDVIAHIHIHASTQQPPRLDAADSIETTRALKHFLVRTCPDLSNPRKEIWGGHKRPALKLQAKLGDTYAPVYLPAVERSEEAVERVRFELLRWGHPMKYSSKLAEELARFSAERRRAATRMITRNKKTRNELQSDEDEEAKVGTEGARAGMSDAKVVDKPQAELQTDTSPAPASKEQGALVSESDNRAEDDVEDERKAALLASEDSVDAMSSRSSVNAGDNGGIDVLCHVGQSMITALRLIAHGTPQEQNEVERLLREEAEGEASDIRAAQLATWKRTYTETEIAQLSVAEKSKYDRKVPAFNKKLQRLQVQRAKAGRANK